MKWYAIFVETGKEEEVKKYIEVLFPKGIINTLVPKRKLIERRKGKSYQTIKKLIPGYILIQTEMDDELYYELRSLPSVYKVLKDDIEPISIREEEMSMILSLTRFGETIELSDIYREGKNIKVISGPLMGMEGIIEKVDHRKRRVKVCLEFLGEYKRIDLGANMIGVRDKEDLDGKGIK